MNRHKENIILALHCLGKPVSKDVVIGVARMIEAGRRVVKKYERD